ncbi:MAG: phosphate signaling complex protein PhoU [Phycisphaerales bacterium JB061]
MADPFNDIATRKNEPTGSSTLDQIAGLKRRMIRQGTVAIGMLEASLDALWSIDAEVALHVREQDNAVDTEEVRIEEACYQILALQQPVAKDFRILAFVLKVNHDIERVADHASSISKVAMKLSELPVVPKFPTGLRELGDRVPAACHKLLRAMLDEDVEVARQIVLDDKLIDDLDKGSYKELVSQLVNKQEDDIAAGLLLYRVGRELERVGDLMKNIAEDVVYLGTGEIVRHSKK